MMADSASYATGTWPVFLVSVFVVASWLLIGPWMHFSDTWQLLINTPTTVLEMWLGFLIAAAANRVQRQQAEQQAQMLDLLQNMDHLMVQQDIVLKQLQIDEQTLVAEEKEVLAKLGL